MIANEADGSTLVGLLDGGQVARVDARGTYRPGRATWSLEWWIGAEDRWHRAPVETAVRQQLLDDMPVVRTAMRIPSGDAVALVGGTAPSAASLEIVNDSPAPFVAALVLRGVGSLSTDDDHLYVDGRAAVRWGRPPSRWAWDKHGNLATIVEAGGASDGPFVPVVDRAARTSAAFLFPVAHRTRVRFLVGLGFTGLVEPPPVADVPDADAMVRGWRAQLTRGMQVALPDPELQRVVDRARSQAMLGGQVGRPTPATVAALEDWGFDDEAAIAWRRLGRRDRKAAKSERDPAPSWARVAERIPGDDPGAVLVSLRSLLARETDDGVDLIAEWPESWGRASLDVRDLPTRAGRISFAIRWHGERPALLWESIAGLRLRAPGLDPSWSTDLAVGETLLARP